MGINFRTEVIRTVKMNVNQASQTAQKIAMELLGDLQNIGKTTTDKCLISEINNIISSVNDRGSRMANVTLQQWELNQGFQYIVEYYEFGAKAMTIAKSTDKELMNTVMKFWNYPLGRHSILVQNRVNTSSYEELKFALNKAISALKYEQRNFENSLISNRESETTSIALPVLNSIFAPMIDVLEGSLNSLVGRSNTNIPQQTRLSGTEVTDKISMLRGGNNRRRR